MQSCLAAKVAAADKTLSPFPVCDVSWHDTQESHESPAGPEKKGKKSGHIHLFWFHAAREETRQQKPGSFAGAASSVSARLPGIK